MTQITRQTRVLDGYQPDSVPLDELLSGGEPVVLRGLVKDWGLVKAGLGSDQRAQEYLRSFYNGRPITFSFGEPQIAGRPFYNDDFTALNFVVRKGRLDEALDEISAHLQDDQPPTYYIASLLVDSCLPGFRKENDVAFAPHGFDPPPSIWIGTRTTASCHYDAPNNIACCAVGRRRFTLFPPDQIFNLYPGPLEPTPGGQAVSLVDFANPDFEKYPRFRQAIEAGQIAEMEPGDALFIPSMWWHHVQGLSSFNTLVNYWWTTLPKFVPTPMNTLYQAIWSLRDRPEREKQAWKNVFEYYVFGAAERAGEHLPEQARGVLGPMSDDVARQIRAMLINNLNR
jgi:hypothetical protein